jgi:hypothetical protein
MLAKTLRGSARDDEQWRSDFVGALGLNLLYSIFLVDAMKVLCLTLTSKPFLRSLAAPASSDDAGALPFSKGRCSSPARLVLRVLRRAHKVFDWLY